jgi:hypothetical protein
MNSSPIIYKRLEPTLIASLKSHLNNRDEIPPLFDRLRAACGDAICGDAVAIFHAGAVKDGFLVEAAFPVTRRIIKDGFHNRTLEAAPALTKVHDGAHSTIRETVLRVYDFLGKRAWTTSLLRREVYRVLDSAEPEKNVTEVQVILHEWDRLLADGVEKVLGLEARRDILQGADSITPLTSFQDYTAWIQKAVDRLDALTDDAGQKCQVVSHCAHVFPKERIEHLRDIFSTGMVDEVLREMHKDEFWYEKPVRRGNVIYMRKNPFNPEEYASALTPAERRKAYCHCPFVHPFLDEIPSQLSPTFCFCGAGWYRQLWEGILGQPVKIEHVETLLRGNDNCTLTIELPFAVAGECFPRG